MAGFMRRSCTKKLPRPSCRRRPACKRYNALGKIPSSFHKTGFIIAMKNKNSKPDFSFSFMLLFFFFNFWGSRSFFLLTTDYRLWSVEIAARSKTRGEGSASTALLRKGLRVPGRPWKLSRLAGFEPTAFGSGGIGAMISPRSVIGGNHPAPIYHH